jgi:hypothetical protein
MVRLSCPHCRHEIDINPGKIMNLAQHSKPRSPAQIEASRQNGKRHRKGLPGNIKKMHERDK